MKPGSTSVGCRYRRAHDRCVFRSKRDCVTRSAHLAVLTSMPFSLESRGQKGRLNMRLRVSRRVVRPTVKKCPGTRRGGRLGIEALESRAMLSAVVGRYVFYDNSAWDGNIAGVNAGDDAAIAPDKVAYRLGDGPMV